MAEELNELENQSSEQIDLSQFNTLPAKPEALEIYDKNVGNPGTGSNPGFKDSKSLNTIDFAESLAQKSQNSMASTEGNLYAAMKPFTYSGDHDVTNFERYYSTGDVYNQLGFNPFDNKTEDLYNNKMTFGDQFRRAASQWDNLVAAGFMSGVKSWETMFTDPLAPDLESARAMEKAMAIGASNAGGLGGFVTNTFLNSGYTVGIGFDFLAEELALAGVTAATGGLAGEVTLPAMFGKIGSLGKNLFGAAKVADKLKDATNTFDAANTINRMDGVRAINDVNSARNFWSGLSMGKVGKAAFDIVNPLENTVQALRATDYATDFAKVSRTFGAFADDLLMMKGAVSEAKIEGGMTKLDVSRDLIEAYTNENGFPPEGEELAKIEALATEEAYRTAFWNMPAIVTTNKLIYATMLAPLRKVMGRELTRTVDDYVFRNKTFSEIGEGFFARAAETGKQLLKPKTFGKLGMNYLKANLAEGVQENLQEAIAIGAEEHAMAMYKDPIRASYEGYMTNFMKGMKAQFSAQGAETFAGGFAMGMFAQPIMSAPTMAISKILNSTVNRKNYEAIKEMQDQIKKQELGYLNEMYENELTYLAPDLQHAVRTGRLADDMYTAGKLGNKKEALDSKDAIQNHHLLNAIKTGKLDIFLNKLKDYKNMSKQELTEAFGKYGIEEQDVDKALGMIDGIVARAKTTRDIYENEVKNFPNPFNPSKFGKGTAERKAAFIAKAAWDEAVYNLVFAKATFDSSGNRIKDIANTFSKISEKLAGQDSQALMVLLNSGTVVNEINALRQEIGTLDDSIPAQKKTKKEKQDRLDRIDAFYDAVASVKFAKTDEEKAQAEQKAKDSFSEYVKVLSDKNGTLPFKDAIDEAYSMIKDSMLLQNDMAGLARSINVLMTPDSFFEFHRRLNTTYTNIFEKKRDIISANREQFELITSFNEALKSIKQSGLNIPHGFLETFIKAHNEKQPYPTPEFFLDDQGKRVTSGKAFDEAMEKWNTFVGLLRKEDAQKAIRFDPRNLSTYPEDLVEMLQNKYDLLDDDIKASIAFEDWAVSEEQAGTRASYFRIKQEQYEGVPEKYKSMSLEELQQAHEQLQVAAASDPSLLGEEKQVADYLAYKKMKDLKMTLKQTEAINSLKAMNNDVEINEDGKYVINGVTFDMRVTGVVYDVIMKGAPYNKTVTNFSETRKGRAIMPLAETLFKEKESGKSNNEIINKWLDSVQGKSEFQDSFDEDKINLIKSELKESEGFEEFKKLINNYAYYESRSAGDTVDNILKNFFDGNPVRKPSNMSEEVFDSIREGFHAVMTSINDRNEVILARNLVVTGEVEINGEKKTIAGEIDLLSVSPDGALKIYDIKTGKPSRWENYGVYFTDENGNRVSEDQYYTKEGYTLQLSMYKALIEAKTGLKVDKVAIIPFVITTNLQGNITSLELNYDSKNIEHTYDPTVEKYVKPVATVSLAPVVQPEEPAPTMSDEEKQLREENIDMITKKIKLLRDRADVLGIEDLYIADTIEELEKLLDNSIDASDLTLKQIQNQINILSENIKSSSAAKTKRGARVIETIDRLKTDLKNTTKKDFDHLNKIVDSIKDLQEESRNLKTIQEDLNKQINYYNSLIADPTLGTLDREQLTNRRDAIQGKVNTISKLLKMFSDAIRKSINYIREYVKEIFEGDKKLSEFTKSTGFKPLSTDEIRTLMKSNLEEDQVFLDNYFKLKDEFEELQMRINDNIDTVEMLEASKAAEEEKRTKLNEVLLKYQDQIRYINDLLTTEQVKDSEYQVGSKNISADPNKPDYIYFLTRNGERLDKNFASKEEGNNYIKSLGEKAKKKIPAVRKVKTAPKPKAATKKAAPVSEEAAEVKPTKEEVEFGEAQKDENQPKRTRKKNEKQEVDKKLKEENKKLAKEEEELGKGAVLLFGVPKQTKKEKKKEKAPEQESIANLQTPVTQELLDQLNSDINKESLKTAMARELGVIFTDDNGEKITTRIAKVTAKSVTLITPIGGKLNVPQEEFQRRLKIVSGGPLDVSKEDNDLVKKNEEVIKNTPISIPSKKDLKDLKNNFIKNLC